MKVDANTVTLTVAELKVLAANAREDLTRVAISNICFVPFRKHVVATDGHMLVAFHVGDTFPQPMCEAKRWVVAAEDVKTVTKGRVSKEETMFAFGGPDCVATWQGGKLAMTARLELGETVFPPYDQLIPPFESGEEAIGSFSLDLKLVARVVDARRALCVANGESDKPLSMRVRNPDNQFAPVRYDSTGSYGSTKALVIVMPMNVVENEKAVRKVRRTKKQDIED